MKEPKGKVYLVGAGPGDPGLITVKGLECIRKADVIIYDYLASPSFLKYASEIEGSSSFSRLIKHRASALIPLAEEAMPLL